MAITAVLRRRGERAEGHRDCAAGKQGHGHALATNFMAFQFAAASISPGGIVSALHSLGRVLRADTCGVVEVG